MKTQIQTRLEMITSFLGYLDFKHRPTHFENSLLYLQEREIRKDQKDMHLEATFKPLSLVFDTIPNIYKISFRGITFKIQHIN